MIAFLRVFAYLCIWTTPLQLFFILWGVWVLVSTDYTLFSLTVLEFITQYVRFLLPVFKWLYTWLWNPYLDFILSLPFVLSQSVKAIFSTWLGFWILKQLN